MLKSVNIVSLFFALHETCPFCEAPCLSNLGMKNLQPRRRRKGCKKITSPLNIYGHDACIRNIRRKPDLGTPALYVGSFGLIKVGFTEGTYKNTYTPSQRDILEKETKKLTSRVNRCRMWSRLSVTPTRNVNPIPIVGQHIVTFSSCYKRKKDEMTYHFIKLGKSTLTLRCFMMQKSNDVFRILYGAVTVEENMERVIDFYHRLIAFDVWIHKVDPSWHMRWCTNTIYKAHLQFYDKPEQYFSYVKEWSPKV